MNFVWAEPYPDLHKICVLFNRTELLTPEKSVYKPLGSFLQNGPQCGLVALAMLIGNPTKELVHKIFEYAKQRKYTYNGEIFSANYMLNLAKEFLKNEHIELYSGQLNSDKIKQFLLTGGFLLVPYDTDKDNSPGLYNGHKAHWCAVSGAVQTSDNFYLLAKHGKARNVAIWELTNLSESNKQLFQFSPDRKLHNINYMLPEEGISGPMGLNSKCVLIYNNISS